LPPKPFEYPARPDASMFDQTTPIQQFLDATAAKKPTPGGGAVTALAGALAAAIGQMAVNYSVGKKGLEAFDDRLRAALGELAAARETLLAAMTADQSAFAALTAERKLPDDVPDKAARVRAAVAAAIAAPAAMAAAAVRILSACEGVVDVVNPYLLSDLAVAADLAMATARCAAYNVRVNLPDVTDPAERRAIEAESARVSAEALALVQRVAPRVWERVGGSAG
jgi:formiminotetrahydrofolate cyclodeaminase